jgi:hypothetical protein
MLPIVSRCICDKDVIKMMASGKFFRTRNSVHGVEVVLRLFLHPWPNEYRPLRSRSVKRATLLSCPNRCRWGRV